MRAFYGKRHDMGMGGEGIGKGECLIRNGQEAGGNKVVSVKHRFYRPTFTAAP